MVRFTGSVEVGLGWFECIRPVKYLITEGIYSLN